MTKVVIACWPRIAKQGTPPEVNDCSGWNQYTASWLAIGAHSSDSFCCWQRKSNPHKCVFNCTSNCHHNARKWSTCSKPTGYQHRTICHL